MGGFMDFAFKHAKNTIPVPITGICECKFYAVDTNYSDDGYYVALWTRDDPEPVPACMPSKIALLAHLGFVSDEHGGLVPVEHYCAAGVEYGHD
jgi:hypothetical protein